MSCCDPISRRLRGAPVLAALVSLLVACGTPSPRYSARTSWPHKDVASITVYIERKLDVAGYLSIVDGEVTKLVSAPSEIPLFEIRFEFFLPAGTPTVRRRVAQVTFYPETGASAPFTDPPLITLY
ncbi:MAG: hypothetical protein O7J95_06470 [Planctomycetota bacterium]|nr:hypothetical protein [Planctomycetota bacterium]